MKPTCESSEQAEAKSLNQSYACVTLDRPEIALDIANRLDEEAESILTSAAWHQIFFNVAVFVPGRELAMMQSMVHCLRVMLANT